MADKMTAEQRRKCMSRIRSKDTRPEIIVRKWLWKHGFRYRLHVRKLPGSPDIVMRKHKIVIFINGCFWHGHNTTSLQDGEISDSECCKIPLSNRQYWLEKINKNIQRDCLNIKKLEAQGWHVLTVWECDLRPKFRQATLENIRAMINSIINPHSNYNYDNENHYIAAEPYANYEIRND